MLTEEMSVVFFKVLPFTVFCLHRTVLVNPLPTRL